MTGVKGLLCFRALKVQDCDVYVFYFYFNVVHEGSGVADLKILKILSI